MHKESQTAIITCLHAPPDFKETESAAGRGVVPRISLVLCVALMLVLVSVERMVERVCYAVNVLECVCVCFLVNNKGKKWINSSHEKLCLRHSQKSQAILIRRRQQNENEGTEMQAQIQISPMSLILRFRLNQVAVLKALKLNKKTAKKDERGFSHHWFFNMKTGEKRHWLVYKNGEMYCNVCRLYSTKKIEMMTAFYVGIKSNFKLDSITTHEKSKTHEKNM